MREMVQRIRLTLENTSIDCEPPPSVQKAAPELSPYCQISQFACRQQLQGTVDSQ